MAIGAHCDAWVHSHVARAYWVHGVQHELRGLEQVRVPPFLRRRALHVMGDLRWHHGSLPRDGAYVQGTCRSNGGLYG